MNDFEFRDQGVGFGVWGSEFRVQGSGFGFQILEFGVWGSGFGVCLDLRPVAWEGRYVLITPTVPGFGFRI